MDPMFHNTRNGTLCGTLLVIIIQVNAGELLKSAVLAATGAFVSFGVTMLLRRLAGKQKRSPKH